MKENLSINIIQNLKKINHFKIMIHEKKDNLRNNLKNGTKLIET